MGVVEIIQLLIAAAGEIPSVITAAQTVIKLVEEDRDPTPEEQAQFDQARADAVAHIPSA